MAKISPQNGASLAATETSAETWNDVTPPSACSSVADTTITGPQFVIAAFHKGGVKTQRINEGEEFAVGRGNDSEMCVIDANMSRRHVLIRCADGMLWIRDLHSTNGTRLNGDEIGQTGDLNRRCLPHELKIGDAVALGNTIISIYAADAFAEEKIGLDSHDRFVENVHQEVLRAQTFHRVVGMLMFSTMSGDRMHLGAWLPSIQLRVRPVDRVALFDPCTAEVLIPETDSAELMELAEHVLATARSCQVHLTCAIALFPNHAKSADELLEVARDGLNNATASHPIVLGREELTATSQRTTEKNDHRLVVTSPTMIKIHRFAQNVAKTNLPVLVQGPKGVGKRALARAIHQHSERRDRVIHFVNCAALQPERSERYLFGSVEANTGVAKPGLLEKAPGGTVVLEDVDRLPLATQQALVRLMECNEAVRVGSNRVVRLNVRIIVTTAEDLAARCARGQFSSRLFACLAGTNIVIPSLSRRNEEILPLAAAFLHELGQRRQEIVKGIEEAARQALCNYDWPGNVRELRNVIERAGAASEGLVISIDDLPLSIQGSTPRVTDEARRKLPTARSLVRPVPDAHFGESAARKSAKETEAVLDQWVTTSE